MKLHTIMPPAGYRVLADTGRSQAATMVLEPGTSVAKSEVTNEACDQWVYVTRGEGRAYVGGCWLDIKAGSLLLIEAGESHEIRATGRIPLETISICATPHKQ
jgi:mannose-6-phosphate isomerase-like protein (cupin superfamily)